MDNCYYIVDLYSVEIATSYDSDNRKGKDNNTSEFYAMEIICYTHCYPTRTVMVTIYVTGDMIELLYLITISEIS